jgi:hypothetical protein
MPLYRIDSLHPDRIVCEACATVIGAVILDPEDVVLGALPSADAAAEWTELAGSIREHDATCSHREQEPRANDEGEAHHVVEQSKG